MKTGNFFLEKNGCARRGKPTPQPHPPTAPPPGRGLKAPSGHKKKKGELSLIPSGEGVRWEVRLGGGSRRGMRTALSFALTLLTLAACNVSRRLPPGEKLYVGAEFKMTGDPGVTGDQLKSVKSGLEDLARPRPVKTLFGFPYKVWLYYVLKEERKQNTTKRKFGEPPVFASARALTANEAVFRAFMENEGHFRSGVSSGFVERRGYQAVAEYTVQLAPRYRFDTIRFLIDSSAAGKALGRSARQTLLKPGDPYRFDNIQLERERISQFMKRQGFYYFQPDYLAILADSGLGNHRVKPYVAFKPEMPPAARLPYKCGTCSFTRTIRWAVRGSTPAGPTPTWCPPTRPCGGFTLSIRRGCTKTSFSATWSASGPVGDTTPGSRI